MLKFFRKYNKLILVFGAAFLMVAFLLEGTLDMFFTVGPQPVGHLEGEVIEAADQAQASREIDLLRRVNPVLGQLAADRAERDPLKWMLMLHEARGMGLAVSQLEVNEVLQMLGLDEDSLLILSSETGAPVQAIRNAVANWLIVEQYANLVTGRTHVSPIERLSLVLMMFQWSQQMQLPPQQLQMLFGSMLQMAEGTQRLSEPLMRHYIYNQRSQVGGQALLIDADAYMDRIDEPDEQTLQELFEQYRDVRPGESEPYGFGYRLPDRVRLAYLAIPIDEVVAAQDIEVADAIEYYEDHQDEFLDDEGEPRSFSEVRSEVMDRLRGERAQQQAARLAAGARSLLRQPERGLPRLGHYRDVPADFEPVDLNEVADRLEQEYGVRPQVHHHTDEWLSLEQAAELPDIGQSYLEGRADVRFPRYLATARELEPEMDDPLVSLGLQVGVTAMTLEDRGGSRYLFRLSDAAASQAPDSLAAVRDQVERDARRKAAYERLLEQRQQWLERVMADGFDALADSEQGVSLVSIPRTPRWQPGQGRMVTPFLPQIGQSEAFLDAMFATARNATDRGQRLIDDADEAERTDLVDLDAQQRLAVYRVQEYLPLTEQLYHRQLAEEEAVLMVNLLLDMEVPDDSLSLEAIQRRVGFEPEDVEDREDDLPLGPEQPPQQRPGQL